MARQPPYTEFDLEAANDTFMLREGLDLLDQFRSIRDAAMRRSVYLMIKQIVATQPPTATAPAEAA